MRLKNIDGEARWGGGLVTLVEVIVAVIRTTIPSIKVIFAENVCGRRTPRLRGMVCVTRCQCYSFLIIIIIIVLTLGVSVCPYPP